MNRQLNTLPETLVGIDGSPLESAERASLEEVRVHQRLSLPTLCEMTFSNDANFLKDAGRFSPGADLSVSLSGFNDALFEGQITAVEYVYLPNNSNKVRVRGYDKLHLLRKRQQVRAFVQVTLEDLIGELTNDLAIAVEVNENTQLRERIIQFEQTDFELMAELAARSGAYFFLRENTLFVFSLEGNGDEIALQLGENLLEAKVELNSDKICRSVRTSGWNTQAVENFEAVTNGGRSGRSISAEIAVSSFGGDFECSISDQTVADETEALALSQAELDWRISQETVFRGAAEGDPKLRPGTPVNISGIAPDLSGKYVLTSVNHTIDTAKGFISEISTVLPKPVLRQKNSLATYGIVVALDDPLGFGRVRVKLPNYRDAETDWMQVLSVGAGLGKGLVALPDIDDTVLVFFPRGELTQGIILGGLFGMIQEENWDWGIEDANTKRFRLQTAGKQKISFDDTRQTLRMENSDGSFVEMSPEKVSFYSRRDLEISAPGRAVLIKGKTIDFEQEENADSD